MILIDALHRNSAAVLREKRLPKSMAQTCHMTSDTSREELVAFGAKIGMPYTWLHNGEHFDPNPGRRRLAVQYGAVEVSTTEFVCRSWDRKQRFREQGRTFYCICRRCPPEIPRKEEPRGETQTILPLPPETDTNSFVF